MGKNIYADFKQTTLSIYPDSCFFIQFHLAPWINNAFSVVRIYIIGMIAAPIAGAITDRVRSASKLMSYSFILYSITFFIMLVFARRSIIFTIITLLFICLFVNMGKSMALVTLDEIRIPPQVYGLSINLISFCAYSPDAFY